MKKSFLFVWSVLTCLSVCITFPAACFAHLPTAQNNGANTIAPMLAKVTPAVVNIYVEEEKLTKLNRLIPTQDNITQVPVKSDAVGSGVIFDAAKGLIVTNAHVVAHEKVIIVTLKNGKRYDAKLIAKDTGYDIAILQIHAKHLTALPFANSDKVKVGDFVTAIGSPYGLSQTVTSGVVSALNRTHPRIEGYQSFIQTDAPINPGNSGGALVNMQGDLIGINTAMVAPTDGSIGLGFSIPSNMVKGVIKQLLEYGKVKHGVMGVIVENMTPGLAKAFQLTTSHGAIITEIVPNTPAAAAGLQPRDVITKINGHAVSGAIQLKNTLGLIRPGDKVMLTIIRNHKIKNITVAVANPKTIKERVEPYFAGLRLDKFSELESDGSRLRGVIVTHVADSSEGALAGLLPGDVITQINSKPVDSISALKTAAKNQEHALLLTIVRGKNNLFLTLSK